MIPSRPDALCHVLEQQHLLSPERISRVLAESAEAQSPLLHYLINEKILDSMPVAQACANYYGLESTDLETHTADPIIFNKIPIQRLNRYTFLPLNHHKNLLVIAISDPCYLSLLDELKFEIQSKIKIVFAPYDKLGFLINKTMSRRIYFSCTRSDETTVTDNAIIDLTNQILTDAIYRDASDIHGESMRDHYRLRMRIDGVLHLIENFPRFLQAPIISRFKVLANLDIAEKRLPQDGRFTFTTISGIRRDCRINCCPTQFGEKIVVRLLHQTKRLLSFDTLGMGEDFKHIIVKKIQQPQGLILVTGPTGSGKSATLYTILNYLNTLEKNISTIEDPVEIQLHGINQVNVNTKAGLDFATALRAFLRQDPDIIMVGEIRDFETASMAIRAAHTGHLVLSTLHTNSAAESITRLINIGIEPFNIASTVQLVVAQRLIRRLCQHCKKSTELSINPETKINGFQANQCPLCLNGYLGRAALFEIFRISDAMRECILNKVSSEELSHKAVQEGMYSLWSAGLQKVIEGVTSLEELHRVLVTKEESHVFSS